MSAFLGVENSLTGKRWRLRGGDDRAGLMLSQRLGLPELVGRIMAARGICLDDVSEAECEMQGGYHQGVCTNCPPEDERGLVKGADEVFARRPDHMRRSRKDHDG